MQCACRELDVFSPVAAGFYHWHRIVGSIVGVVHGGSLLTDQPSAQGAGSAGGAPGELLPSAGINLQSDLGGPTALGEMQAYHIPAQRCGRV
jgi:hypothetical protein